MKKAIEIKIGDLFYKYSFPHIMKYEVIGKQTFTYEQSEKIFYIVKCHNCSGHAPCEIAIIFDDYNNLKYSHMINNCDEDDGESNYHYYHSDTTHKWYKSKDEVIKEIRINNIKRLKDKIEKLKTDLKSLENELLKENELMGVK